MAKQTTNAPIKPQARALPPFRRGVTALDVVRGLELGQKVMLVTGADSGIGFETARALASAGARVHLGSMSTSRGEVACERISREFPKARVTPFVCDLSSLADVRRAVADLDAERLDALICNAGVYGGPFRQTVDGFEFTLGVCHIGHAALVLGLESKLSAPARVVFVSSDNHRWPAAFQPDPLDPESYSELAAYGQAKLCLILFAKALDARWRHQGVRVNALHPGNLISTGIDQSSWLLRWTMRLARPFARTPAQAASTSVWLAAAPEAKAIGGEYLIDGMIKDPSPAARQQANVETLWQRTMEWIALPEAEGDPEIANVKDN